MSEAPARTTSRLAPAPAWTVLTDAPLRGLGLAREAGTILVWDEADGLYLLDTGGRHRSVSRAPGRVLAGAISDDGSLVALLGEGSRLWLLGPDFQMTVDRQGPPEASSLAIDPHGRYVAVASKLGLTQIYNRHGRPAGRFETRQPLAHVCFIPDRPFLLGAAAYGTLAGVALSAAGTLGRLEAQVLWQESLMSNVGRLATSGDGGLILASCFTHGVQRYDLRGQNEGSYHLGGSAAFAVPDFAGRTIGVATLEGELAVLSPGGNVRWKTGLIRPAIALETDPLGRFLIYGHATGEVVRLDLDGAERTATATATAPEAGRPGLQRSGSLRKPDWTSEAVASEDQAETAVLTVLDDPPRIGLISATNRLRIFTAEGRDLGKAPEIIGVGRIARTAPGWIAAATDRQIVLYDARRSSAQRVDLSLVEITHLEVHPDSFGLAIVQERDRLGRATPAGRWIWKRTQKSPVEDLAIGPDGVLAVTTDDGKLEVLDASGATIGGFRSEPTEPLLLIASPGAASGPVAWFTLARRAQVLRGHDVNGRVAWESPLPWEGWQLHRLGPIGLVVAPDGRTLAFDNAGHPRGRGRASSESKDEFGASPAGETWRVTRQGVHLICSDLDGRVKWRAVADGPLGPLAVGQTGVAAIIGRSLAWFSADSVLE